MCVMCGVCVGCVGKERDVGVRERTESSAWESVEKEREVKGTRVWIGKAMQALRKMACVEESMGWTWRGRG